MAHNESNEESLVDTSEISQSMLEDEEELSQGMDQLSQYSTRSKSKNLSSVKIQPKSSKTKREFLKKKQSTSINKHVEKDLKQNMKDYFAYNLRSCDFTYLKEFYDVLNKLEDVWNHIGFNTETKQKRLELFYKHMSDNALEILDNEEELESKIGENIEGYHKKIRDICFKLHIRYDDLKLIKNIDSLTLLEQEEAYKQEYKKLEKEVKKRLDEYEALLTEEAKFCDKLVIDKTEFTPGNIPSEVDLNTLNKRIVDLEKMFERRKREMIQLQIEITELNQELETSRSDSFVEAIIFESVDNLNLGEQDMEKAIELRDQLKHKKQVLADKIRSIRTKIMELWSKLNIENPAIIGLLSDNEQTRDMSKRELVSELETEHERCVAIKMENMQKFIEAIRLEIREMCQKMFIGDKEIKQMNQEFMCLTDFTEELLTIHEEKLEDLKFRYIECQKLYQQTSEWTKLWTKFVQFEEKTKDPMRFKQRGYSMLEEEKQRKKFNSELPKLEEELKQLAQEYASMNGGQEFTVFGQSFADYILTTKLDYEESKQKEKMEKQVLKDTQRKNETRFGSKPKTPLALKNKRKILSNNHHDSNVNSPMRRSKLQKTDMTATTPGTSIMSTNRSAMGSVKAKINSNLHPKSKLAKRKSRTPGNKRLQRRSKMLAKKAEDKDNDTTLKTTFSSTMQSTTSSNSSRIKANGSKCPPLSSSSRFATSHNINRMTSTASNTFIEEDCENVNQDSIVVQAANKITEIISNSNESKFFNCDVNYMEFSRDLPKPINFGHDSTNSIHSTKLSSKSSSLKMSLKR